MLALPVQTPLLQTERAFVFWYWHWAVARARTAKVEKRVEACILKLAGLLESCFGSWLIEVVVVDSILDEDDGEDGDELVGLYI